MRLGHSSQPPGSKETSKMAEELVAMSLTDLVPGEFMCSEKKYRSWDFVKDGKKVVGGEDYVLVYYNNERQKLAFTLEEVKTTNGITVSNGFKKARMSVNLTPEQSAQIRKAVDEPIFQLIFQHREKLLKNGRKVSHPAEIKLLYKGVVRDGEEKTEKKTDGTKGKGKPIKGPDGNSQYWPDSVSGNVPMKKHGNQHIVDPEQCQIIDLEGRPYAWTCLDHKTLREVVVEIEKVVFKSDNIVVHCTFKCIVPNEIGAGAVKYTTKRRLEQEKKAAEGGDKSADTKADAKEGGDNKADSKDAPKEAPKADLKDAPKEAPKDATPEGPPAKKGKTA